jgi:hypothetical protein
MQQWPGRIGGLHDRRQLLIRAAARARGVY